MAVGDQLNIDVRHERDRVVVGLCGELDLASAPVLQSEIQSSEIAAASIIVFDLGELEFIDSTGLRVLLSAYESSRERGQKFAVTRGSQQIERLLRITRVDEHLPIIDSPDEILA